MKGAPDDRPGMEKKHQQSASCHNWISFPSERRDCHRTYLIVLGTGETLLHGKHVGRRQDGLDVRPGVGVGFLGEVRKLHIRGQVQRAALVLEDLQTGFLRE